MRSAELDSHVDIRFDCPPGAGVQRRAELPAFRHARVETLTGSTSNPVFGRASIDESVNFLAINLHGTLLMRAPPQGRLVVVPPASVVLVSGGASASICAGRGEHLVTAVSWASSASPVLTAWMRDRSPPDCQGRAVACQPLRPHLALAAVRLEEARAAGGAEPLLLSAIEELATRLLLSEDELQLASLPPGLPDALRDVTGKVREQPTARWPLGLAADAAGYSAFYFSRVFRSLVGYGFKEFVDRCRTEIAVQKLCTTMDTVAAIAAASGFGTPHSLRLSVLEYLGLLPSEFRAAPEGT